MRRLTDIASTIKTPWQPCDSYIEATHPDAVSSPSSQVHNTLLRFDAATLATYARPNVLLTRGKGLDLYAQCDPNTDQAQGQAGERKYLDFSSGIAVNSLGHADDRIAEVAAEQARRLVHSSNLYHNEWSGELADRMVKMTREHGGLGVPKGQHQDADAGKAEVDERKEQQQQLKVFLANSGTEANEGEYSITKQETQAIVRLTPSTTRVELVFQLLSSSPASMP